MSEDDSRADDEDNPKDNSIKFKENFIIKLTNENNQVIDKSAKQNCKILHISSEFSTAKQLAIISQFSNKELFRPRQNQNFGILSPFVLNARPLTWNFMPQYKRSTCLQPQLPPSCYVSIINALEPSEYPNLFIFIIEEQNFNFLNENQDGKAKQIVEALNKFGAARPLIIQQICETENKVKFYYKAEKSSKIVDIDQHYPEDYELYEEWKNKLNSLDGRELEQFEDEMLKKISSIKESSIILRFLRTLNLDEAFFGSMVLKVAENGSKADLLAVLDASFEDNGRILNNQAKNYIRYVFEDDESGSESQDASDNDEMEVEADLGETSDKDQDDPIDRTSPKANTEDSSQSVFLTAVQHSNQQIIDYLITYWTPLIQQLPVDHQIRISTAAYDTDQLNVLCDLLEISDFPFPGNFSFSKSKINENLLKITEERMEFKSAIEREDFGKIDNFINNNQNLKFVFNIDNNSALTEAIILQKFGVFYYLKSLGFQGERCQDVLDKLDQEDKKQTVTQATEQRNTNIDKSLRDFHKSVLHLSARSLIHNRKISKELEAEYRSRIRSWLKDVQKIAPEMIDVAASCEGLKIIYDFESTSVENASLDPSNASGSTYTTKKWIFIGAKFADKAREQKIKGVLAHELCHYVMGLVYENQEFPYYKGDKRTEEIFKEILVIIDKWSVTKDREPDDECNGIISTVYRLYLSKDFEPELIVRVVHILAHYDDNPEKSNLLQENYKILFDFWYNHVVPEMQNYFKKDEVVIRVNKTVELLSSLSKSKIELKASKDMEQLTKNKITIVTSNIPQLLLINIHKHLQEKCGSLLDSQNMFIEPEKIKNEQVWKDLKDLNARDVKVNVFVDCFLGYLNNLNSILKIKTFNFILVASNEKQMSKLNEICIKKEIKPIIMDINYNWSDLTEKSQTMLLEAKIIFQNNPKISLMELLFKNTNQGQHEVEKIIDDFSNIINDKVFNQLVDKEEISVNSNVDDSKKNNFENLFRKRNFLKKGINFKNEISQEKLISITANQKHVLISDIAGSGKSWVVKNILKIIMKQDPTRWITYVDLKEFIDEFRKGQLENCEFVNYFIKNILKPKTEFEMEIFKNLYENGKVSIIFDAFDEIAPDCAELVANISKKIQFNDGNQLWIVTRDYFEVNLQQKLQIDNVYKLNEFTKEDGINFTVASWILMDLKGQTINNFENCLKNSPNLTKYQEKAKIIVEKVAMSKNQSIGLPQIFSMIADGFKDDKFVLDDLKRSNIFTQFINTMYTRWADFKGILRKQASVQSQDYELNFKELHQYFAILSLFPELVDLLFPDYNISEWPETEIIAGGILNKIGLNYSFNHETFREYFVADFIFKAIKKSKIKKAVVELLVKVLTIHKYGIIRMFLNDFIDNTSILEKVQLELEKTVEKFSKMENLSDYFTENLEHLAKCVIEVLKKGDYEKVTKIISDNISAVAKNTRELKMFSTFTEFLFSYLKDDDLKDMINSQNILHKMIGSDSNVEILEYFVSKLDEKVGLEFVKQELKLMPSGPGSGNIFHHLGSSKNLNENKVQKCFEIFHKYLVDDEIIELLDICNCRKETILEILLENTTNFKPFFYDTEYFFKDKSSFKKFKNIVCKSDSNNKNFLHWSLSIEDIDFHTSVWKLIQKIFENKEELKTFVFQKNILEDNFLHLLLINNTADVIEFTINKFKENFSESDYQKILRSKGGQFGRNLIQVAAMNSKEVKTHQILWKELQDSCKSDEEFLKILGEVDDYGDDVFNLAAAFTTSQVFEFIEKELSKIRRLFIKLGKGNRNLLQSAAAQNKSLKLHEVLWEILRKYFNPSEILEFIKNQNIYGNNLLIDAIKKNTKEVAEWTWKEVKQLLNSNDFITENLEENIQKCEKIIESISLSNQLENNEIEIFKLKWIKNQNSEASKLFYEEIQRSVEQNLNNIKFENLEFFMANENVENHEKLWKNLVKIYKTRADLKKLLSEKDQDGDSFIHLIVIFNTADVMDFTLNKLKENLNESDYQEILRSKGYVGRNLLQRAASNSKEVKTHEILWKELRESCKSNQEFLEILREGDNVFNLAAAFTTAEVFEFMNSELSKIASRDEIRKLFIKLGKGNTNLLQSAARQNKSLEFHKTIWKIIQTYFNSSEILEFVKHLDVNGDNLFIVAKERSTKEILELTWKEVEKVLSNLYTDTETVQKIKKCEKVIKNSAEIIYVKELKFLKLDWIKNPNSAASNLFKESTKYFFKNNLTDITLDKLIAISKNKNVENHEILWEQLLKTLENRQKLAKLLSEKDQNGDNFIHLLVIWNTADVIEFTLQKIKENLSESDYQEILRSKGQFGRNLIQVAAMNSKEVKTHQILWKELRDSCKSDDEFMEILGEGDEDGDDVFNFAAAFTIGEILKFMQKELEKIEFHEEIKKLLTNTGFSKRNLLQGAARQNKCLELHEALWEIIEKYFNLHEILQFIKHRDVYRDNVLLDVIKWNKNEIKELTWNKVRKILKTIGYKNNVNFKKCDEIIKKDRNFLELAKEEEEEVLKLDWIENTNSVQLFRDNIQLLMEKANSDISLEDLKPFMAHENVKNHGKLWKYLEESFNSYENLKELLFEEDKNGDNFIHLIVAFNSADVIEFTINKLKENLSESDYQEILTSKGQFGRNLIQRAANCSKEVKTHQILWKELQSTCKSDEFLEILGEVDENGSDVFNLAASFTTAEVFEFMNSELSKIASRVEIRKMFIKLGKGNRNLFQSAAAQNKSLKLHEVLWEILRKYFNPSEILEFIKNRDISGNNLLIDVIKENTKEVAEWTWKKVKELLNSNDFLTENLEENIQKCEKIIESISEQNQLENNEIEIFKLKWIKNQNSEASKLFDEEIQRLVEQNLNNIKFENLEFFMANENVENHEKLWKNLVQIYKTCADLKKLLSEKDQDGNNFIHLIVIYNTADVIDFTLNKLKENLSESDFHEILRSKGQFGRNLLQRAASNSKEVKTHQILWKELRDSCKSDDEFMEILGEGDEDENNVFNLAATFSTSEILKFIQKELEKIEFHEDIKKLLTNTGFSKRNILQGAAQQNKCLELHKLLWEIIEKYFNLHEILQFIKHRDAYRDNVLLSVIEWNKNEIKELTWNKVRKILKTIGYKNNVNFKKCDEIIKKDQNLLELTKEEKEVLKLDWIENTNSVQLFKNNIQLLMEKANSDLSLEDLLSLTVDENVKNHGKLWKYLEESFNSYENLKKLLFEEDKNGDNFIHLIVAYNTADVIEFTLNKLKENLNESDYKEILRSKGEFGRNLLQVSACASKELKTQQILWKTLRDSCDSDEEYLEILGESDSYSNYVFHFAAVFTTGEIFEFMNSEFAKIASRDEIRKLFIKLVKGNLNLLQAAAVQNKSLEFHKTIWKIIQTYFNSSEILEFVKHLDINGNNLLIIAKKYNTKEILEFTWKEVEKVLSNLYTDTETVQKIQQCAKIIQNILEKGSNENSELLKLDWIKNSNFAASN